MQSALINFPVFSLSSSIFVGFSPPFINRISLQMNFWIFSTRSSSQSVLPIPLDKITLIRPVVDQPMCLCDLLEQDIISSLIMQEPVTLLAEPYGQSVLVGILAIACPVPDMMRMIRRPAAQKALTINLRDDAFSHALPLSVA